MMKSFAVHGFLCFPLSQVHTKPSFIRFLLAAILTTGIGLALAAEKPESLISFDKLAPSAQARVRRVVPGYTFYRRVPMPKPAIHARADIFQHLLAHLYQCSLVAQALKIEDSGMKRRPDGSYSGSDGKGTSGCLWSLRSAPGEQLYFGEGSDKEADMDSGRVVLLCNYREQPPGLLQCSLHGFVKIDSTFQQICSFLFRPFIMGIVDKQLREVVDAPMRAAEEATAHPDKVMKLIDAMPPEDAAKLKRFRVLLTDLVTKS